MDNRKHNTKQIDFLGWFFREGPNGNADSRKHNRSSTIYRKKKLEEQYENCQVTGFTNEQVDEFRQIFDYYDVDNQKVMDLQDLAPALQSLGYNRSLDLINRIADLMTVEEDSTIDFMEFCMIICHVQEELGRYEELCDSFRFLDHNRDGIIDAEELQKMLVSHGDESAAKDAKDFIDWADPEKSGKINYENFIDELKVENAKTAIETKLKPPIINDTPKAYISRSNTCTSSEAKNPPKVPEKQFKSMRHINDKVRIETLNNSIVRAFGGPILASSAVIITMGQKQVLHSKPKPRWPTVRRILQFNKT